MTILNQHVTISIRIFFEPRYENKFDEFGKVFPWTFEPFFTSVTLPMVHGNTFPELELTNTEDNEQ